MIPRPTEQSLMGQVATLDLFMRTFLEQAQKTSHATLSFCGSSFWPTQRLPFAASSHNFGGCRSQLCQGIRKPKWGLLYCHKQFLRNQAPIVERCYILKESPVKLGLRIQFELDISEDVLQFLLNDNLESHQVTSREVFHATCDGTVRPEFLFF